MRGIVNFSVRRNRVSPSRTRLWQPNSACPPLASEGAGFLIQNSSQIADFYTDTGD
jgi:hypothetical protein